MLLIDDEFICRDRQEPTTALVEVSLFFSFFISFASMFRKGVRFDVVMHINANSFHS